MLGFEDLSHRFVPLHCNFFHKEFTTKNQLAIKHDVEQLLYVIISHCIICIYLYIICIILLCIYICIDNIYICCKKDSPSSINSHVVSPPSPCKAPTTQGGWPCPTNASTSDEFVPGEESENPEDSVDFCSK